MADGHAHPELLAWEAEQYTREQWATACFREGVCPECGAELTARARYGSGRIADGVCCSLKCFAKFSPGL